MKQTINITGILPKTSQKSGKVFWIVGSDKGDLSCWSESVLLELNKSFSNKQPIDVEVQEQGDFKTIRAIWKEGHVEQVSKLAYNQEIKTQAMYVSYAKDIFIALVNGGDERPYDKVMEEATNLVKQARDAFK